MKNLIRIPLCVPLIVALAVPRAMAQDAVAAAAAPAAPEASTFAKEQLEQLVAPVALYPDALLMQLLMAATYPLEIVQAQRWLKANPGMTGKALEDGLKEQAWDASVKSICGFPDVLNDMGDNLDWTQDLGDAFLGQEAQLLDAVQVMRGKAEKSGNLKSSEQMVVKEEADNIIVIESADPEIIYVPSYSPTVVYGGWGYPSYYYPALYPTVAPGYGLLAFGVGMAWGAAMWGGCNWGWGHSDVNVDINRQNNFNRNTNINGGDRVNNRPAGGQGGRQNWQHDASHRKGVNYRDNKTASKFGGSGATNRVSSADARGRTGAGASTRPSTGATRPSTGSRPSAGASTRPSTGASPGSSTRSATRPSSGASTRSSNPTPTFQKSSGSGSGAYGGSRSSSSSARSSSSRGSSSRGSSSGGGSRGGGGGGGRGGGGGGGRR